MKKYLALLILIIVFALSGCSLFSQESPSSDSGKFAIEFDAESINQSYLEQNTLTEMSFAGPFYFGSFDGTTTFAQDYSVIRYRKVESIMDVLDESVNLLQELEIKTKDLRGTLDWYVLKISALEPSVSETLYELRDQTNAQAVSNLMLIESLQAIKEEVANMKTGQEWGFLQYQKYAGVLKAVEGYKSETSELEKRFVTLYYLLEGDENKVYQNINKELDNLISPLISSAHELLNQLYFNTASLTYQERLLRTADYWFAQDAVDFLNEEIPKLRDAITNASTSKKILSLENIDFMMDYLETASAYKQSLEKILQDTPQDLMIPENELTVLLKLPDSYFPKAHALSLNPLKILSGSMESVKNTASKFASATGKIAKATWDSTKNIAVATKDVVIGGVKGVGTVIGVGLDTADQFVKSGVDVSQGLYYDGFNMKSAGNIIDQVMGNVKTVVDNYQKGKAGSTVFKEAMAVMNDTNEMSGLIAEKMVAQIPYAKDLGISQSAGWIGKNAAGFFTGLASDAYVVLDPSSSDSDTLKGMASIGLGFVGGSKTALSGTQAMGITVKKSGSFGKNLTSFFKGVDKPSVAKIFPGGVFNTIKNTFSKRGLINAGKKLDGSIRSAFTKGIDKFTKGSNLGYRYLKGNINKNLPNAIKGQFKSFSRNWSGVGNAIKNVMGDNFSGFVNNLVGATVDNQIKNIINNGVDVLGLSDKNIAKLPPNLNNEIKVNKTSIKKEIKQIFSEDIALLPAEPQVQNVPQSDDNLKAEDEPQSKDINQKDDDMQVEDEINTEEDIVEQGPKNWRGSWAGDESGSLNLNFSPSGGPLTGTLNSSYGPIYVNGMVSPEGRIEASLSGNLRYEDYDGKMVSCSVSGTIYGTAQEITASGGYSGICGAEDYDAGKWSAQSN